MLAQFAPTQVEIAAWLCSAAAVIAGLNQAIKLKDNLFGKSVGVKIEGDFVREKDCQIRHQGMDKQFTELKEQRESELLELRKQREQDVEKAGYSRKAIYEKIASTEDKFHVEMSTLRKELSDKIDSLPDRMIATLRNFGAIGKQKL